MTDLGAMIAPKSDQLNADDLIGGPITITVTAVRGMDSKEQPLAIGFEGDKGRPYKPGLSMRRVIVQVWGKQGQTFVGKRMTLYRDPDVKFGKDVVGGIRISHMEGLERETSLPLTITKGQKRPHVVRPLAEQSQRADPTEADARTAIQNAGTVAALEKVWGSARMDPFRDALRDAFEQRRADLTPDIPEDQGDDYVGV